MTSAPKHARPILPEAGANLFAANRSASIVSRRRGIVAQQKSRRADTVIALAVAQAMRDVAAMVATTKDEGAL